jgi:hypothetical protein
VAVAPPHRFRVLARLRRQRCLPFLIYCIEIGTRQHRAEGNFFTSGDDLRPIARSLVKMICRGEPNRALDQYVGSELNQLSIEPNPYDEIVDEACTLVRNSN